MIRTSSSLDISTPSSRTVDLNPETLRSLYLDKN